MAKAIRSIDMRKYPQKELPSTIDAFIPLLKHFIHLKLQLQKLVLKSQD